MTLKENKEVKELVSNELKKKDEKEISALFKLLIALGILADIILTWLSTMALLEICNYLGVF